MATDYILFVHGVRTHDRGEFVRSSEKLLAAIRQSLGDRDRHLEPIFLFWGDLNEGPQATLRQGLKSSPQWRHVWMQDFRTQDVLEFVGDAALYLSRHVGANVVRRFYETASGPLQKGSPSDRLHLVTHSMGTVILFDMLFARRWEDADLDHDSSTSDIRGLIDQMRNFLFGVGRNPDEGLPIESIHTMGSPIALFSLLSVTGESTHDLTINLKKLLQNLYHHRELKRLPWLNLMHPGDPIAYPLQGVIPDLLDEAERYVNVKDVITVRKKPFLNVGLLPLLKGGDAHTSYWEDKRVAEAIATTIRAT